MRPVIKVTGATGPSAWIPIDYMQKAFAIGFECTVGGATAPSMTYKVQHAFYCGVPDTEIYLTRSGSTATLVFNAINGPDGYPWVNHGLSTGDNIFVYGAGAPFDSPPSTALNAGAVGIGVNVVDNRTVTYVVSASGPTVAAPGASVQRLFVGDHPVVTGVTGTTAGNYAYPPNYVRTNITVFGSGSLTLSLNQGV
jgi:hypothetical protein